MSQYAAGHDHQGSRCSSTGCSVATAWPRRTAGRCPSGSRLQLRQSQNCATVGAAREHSSDPIFDDAYG